MVWDGLSKMSRCLARYLDNLAIKISFIGVYEKITKLVSRVPFIISTKLIINLALF
jgi:hypothetical protein